MCLETEEFLSAKSLAKMQPEQVSKLLADVESKLKEGGATTANETYDGGLTPLRGPPSSGPVAAARRRRCWWTWTWV